MTTPSAPRDSGPALRTGSRPWKLTGAAPVWVLIATLACVTAIRLRLAAMPLERDEGEYAYMGQLMLAGVPPYEAAYNMKWPGTYASYAVIMAVFGQSAAAIRVGLILVNLATAFFVYQIARRCTDVTGGCLAAAAYAVLSISPAVLGLAAHATHFVLLPALIGVWLVQSPEDHRRFGRLLIAGAAVGTAAVMKQSGAAFFGFLLFWVGLCAWREKARPRAMARRLVGVAAGFAAPVGLMFALVAVAGNFARFWFWTWDYARAYAGLTPISIGAQHLADRMLQAFGAAPVLAVLAVVGALTLAFRRSPGGHRGFVGGLALFSFLAVCPGLNFSNNYLLQLLPALAVLISAGASIGVSREGGGPSRIAWTSSLFAAIGVAQALYLGGAVFFRLPPPDASRVIYGANPFAEAEVIGRYLGDHCPENARIAVIGSEPEMYFYARRRAATGYLYIYPLNERQRYARRMLGEFIAEVERSAPEYVVFVDVSGSWFSSIAIRSETPLMRWFTAYERNNLTLVGLAEMRPGGTIYRWTFDQPEVPLPPSMCLAVFRRAASPAGTQPAAIARPRTTIAW